MKKLMSVLLCLFLLFSLAACNKDTNTPENNNSQQTAQNTMNLMATVKANKVTPLADTNSQNIKATDFALRLFNACQEKDKNTLISPLSVISALAMSLNGAEEETLKQMEETLGMTRDDLNLYLYTYAKNLPQGEKYKLNLANSIWFKDSKRFTVNQSFLQKNADFYGADIYKAPFNQSTVDSINSWVNQNTDGMIPEIINELGDDAVMCLVNALAFEAEWASPYRESAIKTGTFTSQSGAKQEVSFMASNVYKHLEDQNATGFIKHYSDNKYAFVALLPNEGVGVNEYLASLNGSRLNTLLNNPQDIKVYNKIPKFEVEYEVRMVSTLKSMGMPDAFDAKTANFTGLGKLSDGNIFIGDVIHKTFISVAEKGTKAGAATGVFLGDESSGELISLDRPFVYMLIDCENNVPFFIGTMMDVNA